jgi:hypothetical protein
MKITAIEALTLRCGRSFCALVLSLACHAPDAAEPNGCGSGWSTFVVPDRIALLNCDMKASCDEHDRCYSICDKSIVGQCEYRRCRKGGDLLGKDVCREDEKYVKLIEDAQKRRAACDARLGDEIRAKNPDKWGCKAVAVVYRYAVKQWGDGSFAGFGTTSEPAAWKQSQTDYNKAITDFLSEASEDDLKKFVEAADTANPMVNFCGRLRYSRDEGLANLTPEDRNACKVPAR